MTDAASSPALSAGEQQAAEAVLARVWGPGCEVWAAAGIWDRAHVVRLQLADGRSAVLKRRGNRGHDEGTRGRKFEAELAALELLNGMPVPVAPRLLGSDASAGILVMEDLGQGVTLADSLLSGERERAEADLVAYAQALGSMHAWTIRRAAGPDGLDGLPGPDARPAPERGPGWLTFIADGKDPFLAAAARLGLSTAGVASEIDRITVTLRETRNLGLVHDDACPDNVLLRDGACRLIDFESSGWGAVVLDAGYLLAPFPSCWCFASLPGEVAAPAVEAYRASLEAAGIGLGAGCAFIDRPSGDQTLPRLRVLAREMHERLSSRWPQTRVPEYPALARPGSEGVPVPDRWPPRPGVQVDP